MAEPIVLSGSSLNTFLRCGLQWEFAYVRRIRRPPTLKLVVGIAGHDAVATNLTQKMDSGFDLPEDEVVSRFADEYDALLADVDLTADEDGKTEDPGKAKDSGVAAVRLHHTKVAPTIQPVMVEHEVQYEINSIPYAGTLDLVDQHHVVRDWKFTGRRPQSGADYALNMVGYALGYRHATGEEEAGVTLDYLVRTKEPYHWPVVSGPIPDSTKRTFAKVVQTVHSQIQRGEFLPNGLLGNACGWCGYRDICPAYKNRK